MSVLAALAGEIIRAGASRVSYAESNDYEAIFVTVNPNTATAYAQRLGEPLKIGFQDGDDNGRVWNDERRETPTEAAFSLLGLQFEDLVYRLRRDHTGVSESIGTLYFDGSDVVVVLTTDDQDPLVLANIQRDSGDGAFFPVLDPSLLELAAKPLQVFTPETVPAPQN